MREQLGSLTRRRSRTADAFSGLGRGGAQAERGLFLFRAVDLEVHFELLHRCGGYTRF